MILSKSWFAIQTTGNREQAVSAVLQSKGYETFAPSYFVTRTWSDRVKQMERALIPGYLFCRLGTAIGGPIVTTSGVIRIVSTAGQPTPIHDEDIAALQAVVQSQLKPVPHSFLQKGRTVEVQQGPLRGVKGVIIRIKGRERIVISIEPLTRAISVELNGSLVA